MNYVILFIVLIIGIAFGFYFSNRNKNTGLIDKQAKVKQKNISKIMELFHWRRPTSTHMNLSLNK